MKPRRQPGLIHGALVAAVFSLLVGLSLSCGRKSGMAAQPIPRLQLSQSEKEQLIAAGNFLISRQLANGLFEGNTEVVLDSHILQASFAIRALLLLRDEFGLYQNEIQRARTALADFYTKYGMWSYLRFLPPDLDDSTGALLSLDHQDGIQSKIAREATGVILKIQGSDGGIPTWLTSLAGKNVGNDVLAKLNPTQVDPEVLGYFMYYLSLYHADSQSPHLVSGKRYLLNRQQRDGLWPSTWYLSKYYGTYRVLQFLSRADKKEADTAKKIQQARAAVLSARSEKGIWSFRGKPSVIDTALCLSIIAATESTQGKTELQPAADFLRKSQTGNGSWPGEGFFLDFPVEEMKKNKVTRFGNELYSTSVVVESMVNFYRSRERRTGPQ